MSELGMMKTAARSEMIELGPMTDDQLHKVNEICQVMHDAGKAGVKKALEEKKADYWNELEACQRAMTASIEGHGRDNNPYMEHHQTRINEAQIKYRLMCDLVNGAR